MELFGDDIKDPKGNVLSYLVPGNVSRYNCNTPAAFWQRILIRNREMDSQQHDYSNSK